MGSHANSDGDSNATPLRVLAIIPARGGSKGVPRKNIRPLGGRPLIEWTIRTARQAGRLDSVVVSTDDAEIAQIARDAGADVPFLRPEHLALDETPTLPVVLDVIDRLEDIGERFDAVCLLQPTSPFRPPGAIDEAIDLLESASLDSVISVRAIPHAHHPDWALVATDDGLLCWATGRSEPPARRQELAPAFHREGSIYLTRTEVLRDGSLYGARVGAIEMNSDLTVNIDTESDWELAERLVARHSSGWLDDVESS